MASNSINLISEDVYADRMDVQNIILANMAKNTGSVEIDNFKTLQTIVRLGLADKALSIGDQIISEKTSSINATVGNTQGNTGITGATVTKDTFLQAMGTSHSRDYEFTYNGVEWHYNDEPVNLTTYGIAVTGTPIIGDEIIVHETATALVWDVIGIDADIPADSQFQHSVTLGLHDVYTELQFDAAEALFAAPSGLSAGTYNFTVSQQPWYAGDVGKTIQFTLNTALPAGGQIMINNAYNTSMIGSTIFTYSNPSSTSALEIVTMSEGSDGTSLGSVSNAKSSTINSIQRAFFGNNNYSESALRQYINSKATAGNIWKPQNVFDRPPAWLSSIDGFLNSLDEEFVNVIGKVKKKTALNNICDGGGSTTTDEKFFLLSRSEVYAGDEITGGEGSPYAYYSSYSDHSVPTYGADTNRIKYRSGSAKYWWLRTPTVSYARYVRLVHPSGALDYISARDATGVAPACCII